MDVDDEEQNIFNSRGDHMYAAREIISIAKKPDCCIDFPLSQKLSDAFPSNIDVALTIAGFIILASAQIYVRKIDYLSQDTFEMAQNFKLLLQKNDESQISTEPKDNQPTKRTRTKKFNIKENSDLFEVEFREKPIKPAKDEDIFGDLKRPDAKNKVQALKDFFDKHRAIASKKTKLILPKRFALSSDNECVAMIGKIDQNSKAVREDHFYDYEGEEIVGSRKDFAVYSYIIDSESCELMYDHNFKRFLNPIPTMDQEQPSFNETSLDILRQDDEEGGNRIIVDQESLSFNETPDVARSAYEDDNRMDSCSFNIEPQLNSTQINENQTMFHIQDLSSINMSTLDAIDISADTIDIPSISLLTEEEVSIYPELTTDEIDNLSKQEMSVRLTDIKSCSSTGILSGIQLNDVINLKSLSASILTINRRALKRRLEFSLPTEYFSTRIENILRIPMKHITKSKIFDLPADEYDYLKKRKKDQGKSTCESELKPPKIIEVIDVTPQPTSGEISVIDDANVILMNSESDTNVLPSDNNLPDTLSDTENCATKIPTENMSSEDSGIEENGESPNVTPLDSENSDADDGFFGSQHIAHEKTDSQREQIENMQKLVEKVNSWHEYLKPILRRSWERADFQVKEYAGKIIKKIGDNDGQLKFSETVVPGELARYFISTLDLINKNNVGINYQKQSDQPTKLEDIELTLLSTEMHHDKIDTISEQIENNRKRALLREEYEPPVKKIKQITTSTPINKIDKSKINRILIEPPLQVQVMRRLTSVGGTDSVYSSQSSGYCSQESVFSSQTSTYSSQYNSMEEEMDLWNLPSTSKSIPNYVPANQLMPSVSKR